MNPSINALDDYSASRSDFMQTVDFSALGKRVTELLRLGQEEIIELSLLRSGQILISKSEEKDGKKDATPI
jgi:hypothetical protein